MDNKKIVDYLHELVRKRNLEQVQNQELNNWTEVDDKSWQDRTDEIYAVAEELEKKSESEECQIMTLDEAIEHANEIAEKDDSSCANNHKQLADWLSELKDLKSKYAYLAADFDNYKKRVARNEAYVHDNVFQDVILKFLRTYDDIERAYLETKRRSEHSELDTAVELIFENLEKTLESLDCKKIECKIGDKFNVDCMEAISAKESESSETDDVVDVFQSGWKYKDKILRPTKVIVAK